MKRLVSLMLIALFMATIFAPSGFARENSADLADNVKSAILIERDTGTVLYEKNSDGLTSACQYDKSHDHALNYGSNR